MIRRISAKMDCSYYTGDPARVDDECVVEVSEFGIEVRYDNDDGKVISYLGRLIGDNHYELYSAQDDCRATLHGFPGSKILEGSWSIKYENYPSEHGFWKIKLSESI